MDSHWQAHDHLAGVAEGHATIHAAGALLAHGGFGQMEVKFAAVGDAFAGRSGLGGDASILYKSGWLTHTCFYFPLRREASFELSSKAAISASSRDSPLASILF